MRLLSMNARFTCKRTGYEQLDPFLRLHGLAEGTPDRCRVEVCQSFGVGERHPYQLRALYDVRLLVGADDDAQRRNHPGRHRLSNG